MGRFRLISSRSGGATPGGLLLFAGVSTASDLPRQIGAHLQALEVSPHGKHGQQVNYTIDHRGHDDDAAPALVRQYKDGAAGLLPPSLEIAAEQRGDLVEDNLRGGASFLEGGNPNQEPGKQTVEVGISRRPAPSALEEESSSRNKARQHLLRAKTNEGSLQESGGTIDIGRANEKRWDVETTIEVSHAALDQESKQQRNRKNAGQQSADSAAAPLDYTFKPLDRDQQDIHGVRTSGDLLRDERRAPDLKVHYIVRDGIVARNGVVVRPQGPQRAVEDMASSSTTGTANDATTSTSSPSGRRSLVLSEKQHNNFNYQEDYGDRGQEHGSASSGEVPRTTSRTSSSLHQSGDQEEQEQEMNQARHEPLIFNRLHPYDEQQVDPAPAEDPRAYWEEAKYERELIIRDAKYRYQYNQGMIRVRDLFKSTARIDDKRQAFTSKVGTWSEAFCSFRGNVIPLRTAVLTRMEMLSALAADTENRVRGGTFPAHDIKQRPAQAAPCTQLPTEVVEAWNRARAPALQNFSPSSSLVAKNETLQTSLINQKSKNKVDVDVEVVFAPGEGVKFPSAVASEERPPRPLETETLFSLDPRGLAFHNVLVEQDCWLLCAQFVNCKAWKFSNCLNAERCGVVSGNCFIYDTEELVLIPEVAQYADDQVALVDNSFSYGSRFCHSPTPPMVVNWLPYLGFVLCLGICCIFGTTFRVLRGRDVVGEQVEALKHRILPGRRRLYGDMRDLRSLEWTPENGLVRKDESKDKSNSEKASNSTPGTSSSGTLGTSAHDQGGAAGGDEQLVQKGRNGHNESATTASRRASPASTNDKKATITSRGAPLLKGKRTGPGEKAVVGTKSATGEKATVKSMSGTAAGGKASVPKHFNAPVPPAKATSSKAPATASVTASKASGAATSSRASGAATSSKAPAASATSSKALVSTSAKAATSSNAPQR
ncbi:unnamed protein product [Amoebophrya sp. A25]|nr:unnamed protein product [Amoebophrya sp. A25]|eukprot:GSA25T00012353001.1